MTKNIESVLKTLKGTRQAELLAAMEEMYSKIEEEQSLWYQKAQFFCPEGCGSCCHHFEPDLLEVEALYMAAWILENQPEIAEQIAQEKFPFNNGDTCPFHDFENPYHCTIYGGRPAICRLFGASGAKDKGGNAVWKPCKFYPIEKLAKHNPPLSHIQYSKEQTEEFLGAMPPLMSNLMEGIVSLENSGSETRRIREILPETIRKLMWICSMNEGKA